MFKPGQWIYGIEVDEEDYDEAEVSGFLFMAECDDYIVCCAEYLSCENNFKSQLKEMYKESFNNYGIEVNLLKKALCFETKDEAYEYLHKLRQ